MAILTNVLGAPVVGPLKGVLWLSRLLLEQAEAALYDETAIRAGLFALEERLEAGEIDEAQYEKEEDVLLERLRIARERLRGGG